MNRSVGMILAQVTTTCLLGAGRVCGANPAVIWASQPVEPGEAVMVFGGPWTDVKSVELEASAKKTVTPLRVTDDCVTFVYPADWPQTTFTARIVDAAGTATVRINAPDVWWMQGDAGKNASPGGWLRIFGRSMGYGDGAFIELRGTGKATQLPVAVNDLYAMRVEVPANLPAGDYEVFVNNGLNAPSVSAGGLSIAQYKEPWPEKQFNVMDYGAVPNDQSDDTRAIRAALAAVTANGGGILYFPRGRFGMTGTIELPPNTLLRGAGMTLSQIYWLDEDEPKGALVRGRHDFGLEAIFLAAGNIAGGIVVEPPAVGDTWSNGNILLCEVRARFLHTDTVPQEESDRRRHQSASPLRLEGDFIRVLNCDFYMSKGNSSLHGDNLLVRGNNFAGASCSYVGGRQVVYEANVNEGRGISFSNGSRNVLLRHNRLGYVYNDGDRETFTFDGGRATYGGPAVSVGRQEFTLPPGAWRDSAESWLGETVCIIGGKGAGQTRYIKKIEGRRVEIDKPWDILPATDSYFMIGLARQHLLFLDNHVGDGNPFQLYGSGTDVVIAGNRVERNSGLHAFGMSKGGHPEPSWFVQFLGNEIVEGNAVRGPWSYMMPAADGWLAFFDRGIVKPLNYPQARVGVMRRNVLDSNANLYTDGKVENMLVENNLIMNADQGISVQAKGAVLRGNRFENVVRPYANVASDAVLTPADQLLGGLLGAAASLKPDTVPLEWPKFIAEAEMLAVSGKANISPAATEILERALRCLATKTGETTVPSAVVENLLGLRLAQSSPWLLNRLEPGKDTKVGLGGGDYPVWSIPATLAAETDCFEGWSIHPAPPVKLVPGQTMGYHLTIQRPAGEFPPFTLPVRYTISGEGWKFRFTENYSRDQFDITEYLAVGPFKNASGKKIDAEVHPPELMLNVKQSYDTLDGKRSWVAVKADEKGDVKLNTVFANSDLATSHVVAVIRAARPIRVEVPPGGADSLLFINGERIGSSSRRDASRCVELRQGDNLLHRITSNASGDWNIKTQITVLDPVVPGELRVVLAEELFNSPLLVPQASRDEGGVTEHALGVDWELVYQDAFERMRLGDGWSCKSPSYMSQAVVIVDGALKAETGWGFLTWETPVAAPVRIEFDLIAGDGMAGVYLCPAGLSWRSFWGRHGGRGYCLSFGWHDAKNNRVLRDSETVLLDEKGPKLETGKRYRVMAQFVKPRCQLYIDGALVLDYDDASFLPALDRIGLFSVGGSQFDNVRIFTGQ